VAWGKAIQPLQRQATYLSPGRVAECQIDLACAGSELALARRREPDVIDFLGEVKDDYGVTIQNVRDTLDIRLTDQTAAGLTRRPIQYETGFTLLPGKYVLKVARDAETGRIGTF
jgi:hypothetical protein